MSTTAAILAGGAGTRAGTATPKQFVEVAGRTLLEHAIAPFDRSTAVDSILVVVPGDRIADAEPLARRASAKVEAILPGGVARSDSSRVAIEACTSERILIHDAARPLVTVALIDACVAALDRCDAVDVVSPSTDSLVRVTGDRVVEALDRESVRISQTPQGFRLDTIRRAYELAAADPRFAATDDCGVVHRYLPDVPIFLVEGSPENIKVTAASDLIAVEAILRAR